MIVYVEWEGNNEAVHVDITHFSHQPPSPFADNDHDFYGYTDLEWKYVGAQVIEDDEFTALVDAAINDKMHEEIR